MKIRIAIAVLLLLLIGEFAFLAFNLPGEYDVVLEQTKQEEVALSRRTQEVEEKQVFLDTLKSNKALETDAETQRVLEEVTSLLNQIQQMQTLKSDLEGSLQDKKDEFSQIEERFNYYTEVCNELKKGIEAVESYIAGN